MTQKERESSMMKALFSLSSPDLLIAFQIWVILNWPAGNVGWLKSSCVCVKSAMCMSLHLSVISEHIREELKNVKTEWIKKV